MEEALLHWYERLKKPPARGWPVVYGHLCVCGKLYRNHASLRTHVCRKHPQHSASMRVHLQLDPASPKYASQKHLRLIGRPEQSAEPPVEPPSDPNEQVHAELARLDHLLVMTGDVGERPAEAASGETDLAVFHKLKWTSTPPLPAKWPEMADLADTLTPSAERAALFKAASSHWTRLADSFNRRSLGLDPLILGGDRQLNDASDSRVSEMSRVGGELALIAAAQWQCQSADDAIIAAQNLILLQGLDPAQVTLNIAQLNIEFALKCIVLARSRRGNARQPPNYRMAASSFKRLLQVLRHMCHVAAYAMLYDQFSHWENSERQFAAVGAALNTGSGFSCHDYLKRISHKVKRCALKLLTNQIGPSRRVAFSSIGSTCLLVDGFPTPISAVAGALQSFQQEAMQIVNQLASRVPEVFHFVERRFSLASDVHDSLSDTNPDRNSASLCGFHLDDQALQAALADALLKSHLEAPPDKQRLAINLLDRFVKLLVPIVQISGGAPLRASSMALITLCSTSSAARNVFVHNGCIVVLATKSKAEAIVKRNLLPSVHVLDPSSSRILALYALLYRKLHLYGHLQLYGETVHSDHAKIVARFRSALFVSYGHQMTSASIRNAWTRLMTEQQLPHLQWRPYRHFHAVVMSHCAPALPSNGLLAATVASRAPLLTQQLLNQPYLQMLLLGVNLQVGAQGGRTNPATYFQVYGVTPDSGPTTSDSMLRAGFVCAAYCQSTFGISPTAPVAFEPGANARPRVFHWSAPVASQKLLAAAAARSTMPSRIQFWLRQLYRSDTYRSELQQSLIELLLLEQEKPPTVVIGVGAPSAGKSAAVLVIALCQPQHQLTLYIGPYTALNSAIVDQANANLACSAALLNDVTGEQLSSMVRMREAWTPCILLVATPEAALEKQEFLRSLSAIHRLALVVIDEAHHIETCSATFRPHYRHVLTELTANLMLARMAIRISTPLKLLLLSASMPPKMQVNLEARTKAVAGGAPHVSVRHPTVPRGKITFNIKVLATRAEQLSHLTQLCLAIVHAQGQEALAVALWVRSRPEALELQLALLAAFTQVQPLTEPDESFPSVSRIGNRLVVTRVHADLSPTERQLAEQQWAANGCPAAHTILLQVATSAMGEGLSNPHCCYSLHFDLPLSVIDFHQQVFRAARSPNARGYSLLVTNPKSIRYWATQAVPSNDVALWLTTTAAANAPCIERYLLEAMDGETAVPLGCSEHTSAHCCAAWDNAALAQMHDAPDSQAQQLLAMSMWREAKAQLDTIVRSMFNQELEALPGISGCWHCGEEGHQASELACPSWEHQVILRVDVVPVGSCVKCWDYHISAAQQCDFILKRILLWYFQSTFAEAMALETWFEDIASTPERRFQLGCAAAGAYIVRLQHPN